MMLAKQYTVGASVYREYQLSDGGRLTVVTAGDEQQPAIQQEPARLVPGSAAASAARRAGQEDAYIDWMSGRYGGQW